MALFKSKIGLIAATVGSAVGLGSVWRFPAETQANGGAAFLLVYLLCSFGLGVPVMLAEFSLGRAGRTDIVGVFHKFSPRTPWWLTGVLGIVTVYLILVFYMVVGAWTLEYFTCTLTGDIYGSAQQTGDYFGSVMQRYVATDWMPVWYTVAFIGLNIAVLLGGVQKGIERMSNIMMPMLFVLLVGFCGVSLTLPGAQEGLDFFLKPDFSKITPEVLISALGQSFFSLSLGLGILVTYGSYFPDSTKLGRTSLIVVSLTLLVAILMGLLIFPAVASFGLSGGDMGGTTLVFVTLPQVFAQLPCPAAWSALFFLLLIVAALTSTVSMAEVPIKFLQDRYSMSRTKAVVLVLLPLMVLAGVCALSFGVLKDWTLNGYNMFSLLDTLTGNYLMPITALLVCVYVGWCVPRKTIHTHLHGKLVPFITPVVRYLAPAVILAILLSNIL